MTAQGLSDALEPRRPKTPAPDRRALVGRGRAWIGQANARRGASRSPAELSQFFLTFYFKNSGFGRSRMKT